MSIGKWVNGPQKALSRIERALILGIVQMFAAPFILATAMSRADCTT